MKKIIALFLALVMVFGLVACGETAQKPAETKAPEKPAETKTPEKPAETEPGLPYEGITLTLGFTALMSGDIDITTQYLEEVLTPFEEATGATVEYTINDSAEIAAKYLTNFMSGTQYDVFLAAGAVSTDMVENGFVEPLESWFTEEEIANETLWDTFRYPDGKVYQTAFEGGVAYRCYSYNMDILRECGVEEVPTTWEELKAACAKIKEKRPDVYPFLVPMADIHCIYNCIYPFLIQAGGDLLTADKSAIKVDTPEMKRAYEFLKEMVDNGYLSTDALGLGLTNIRDLWKEGQAAIVVTNNPHKYVGDFEAYASTEMADVRDGCFNAVDGLAMSAACENKEAAAALMKYLNSHDAKLIFSKYRDVASLRATDPEFPADPLLVETFAHPERAFVGAIYDWPGDIWDVWLSITQQIAAGSISIDDALAQFQEQVDISQAS